MSTTKEQILEEIRQTAKENGGVPLGIDRFTKSTGIGAYDIGKYWPRFSDAQREAGFNPNQKTIAYEESFLLDAFIKVIREFGHFPTRGEMRVKRVSDSSFPPDTVYYRRFGGKASLVKKISLYAKGQGYDDVVEICAKVLDDNEEQTETSNSGVVVGEVYLFKSGRYYKIGKTNDTVRRGTELRIQLPEKLDLIHSIKTDDPSGIEAYWHRRFEAKRMNGEWFDLNSADIRSFKSWKKII